MTTCSRADAGAGFNYSFLTQKERDSETGLDYFLARYYSSTQGRFTSPDQPFADQYEDDPQSWNLYSYVGNNPLSFTDPFGLWKWAGTDDNGNRLIQWEKDDDWYTLSTFLYNQTGRDYLPSDLERAYSSGGLGHDTLLDFSGAPSRYFTNNRGGVQDSSWEVYGTVLPAVRGLKVAGGLISGAWRGVAGLFARSTAAEFAGGVTRAAIQAAASDAGPTIQVVTKLTQAPGAGRALSVATGEGAEALANAARAGGQVYRANIPKALIETLKSAGESVTQMGGVTAREYRFAPEAAEFISRFFR